MPEHVDELGGLLNGYEWVSLRRLSELLDVKQSTIRSWMLRGSAPTFYKLGHLTRFRAEDIRAWLAENRNRQTDRPTGQIDGQLSIHDVIDADEPLV